MLLKLQWLNGNWVSPDTFLNAKENQFKGLSFKTPKVGELRVKNESCREMTLLHYLN